MYTPSHLFYVKKKTEKKNNLVTMKLTCNKKTPSLRRFLFFAVSFWEWRVFGWPTNKETQNNEKLV